MYFFFYGILIQSMRNVLKSVTNIQNLLSVDITLLIKSTIVEVKKCCVIFSAKGALTPLKINL